MRRVTLVGERWATPGARFLNAGPCEVAATCPVAKPCQGLPWDREYEVVAVRAIHHDVCRIHESGVRVVEVEELPVRTSLDASKTRGTMARWTPPVCRFRGCPNWDRCFPHGLIPGNEYALVRVEEPLVCPMGYNLVGAVMEPAKK